MLAEVALAALVLFPWSLIAVPIGWRLLQRFRCRVCGGSGRKPTFIDGLIAVPRCGVCRGWGHVLRSRA